MLYFIPLVTRTSGVGAFPEAASLPGSSRPKSVSLRYRTTALSVKNVALLCDSVFASGE
jgi:hypothetical protein